MIQHRYHGEKAKPMGVSPIVQSVRVGIDYLGKPQEGPDGIPFSPEASDRQLIECGY